MAAGTREAAASVTARRRHRLVGWLVIAPLGLALIVSVWRIGESARAARGATLVEAGEAAVAEVDVAGAIARLARLGLAAAWYDAADGYRLAMAGPRPAGEVPWPRRLSAEAARDMAALDRGFAIPFPGITALVPVKDRDQWDVLGALAVRAATPDPPRFPARALMLAVIALALSSLAGLAWARRPVPARLPPLIAPPAAFAAWAAIEPAAGVGAGDVVTGQGFWPVVLVAGWMVVAAIGLGIARIADRPLAAAEAGRAWAFLLPSFAHLLVFSIGPILFALWLSFHEWNLLEPTRPFVGFGNYRELAADAGFWRAVRNTGVYVLFVPAGMVAALALALFVDRRVPGVRALRTVLFLPYITSFVAISLVWRWMFQPDYGLLNNALGRLGIPPQPWLSSPATAMPSLMLMSVWMYAGYMMILFLAGLQNIPSSLYESARIDGAGPWQRFRHITLPMLRPTLLFVLVTMVIFMFQVFTAIYVMTEGGPLHATDVVVYHIYRAAWEYLRMGYASAMAWVLFAIVFLVTLVQFRWLGARPAQ